MQIFVKIKKGQYRIWDVSGTFPLVKALEVFKKGSYLTVETKLQHPFVVTEAKIKIADRADIEYCTADGKPVNETMLLAAGPEESAVIAPDYERLLADLESETDAMDRIKSSFEMLVEIVIAACEGTVRGLIVTGPPGVGKSYGVIETLRQQSLQYVLAGLEPRYEIITGNASPIGLYQKLYSNRHKGRVLMLDDFDGVWTDELKLNIMKGILDSGDQRRVCWNTESNVLKREDIPDSFDFEASVIFLTNINFEKTRASKIKEHLRAIMSRCHYLDLEISSQRDQLLRVRQVVRDGMLEKFNFKNGEEIMIVDYVVSNADYLREISLRMVKKIADLVKAKPKDWLRYVEATCLERQAKFKRLWNARTDVAKVPEEPLIESLSPDQEPSTPEHENLVHPAASPNDPAPVVKVPETVPEPKKQLPNNVLTFSDRNQRKWCRKNGGAKRWDLSHLADK